MIFSEYRSSESYRKRKAAETYKMTGVVLRISNGTMIVEPLEGGVTHISVVDSVSYDKQ